MISAWALGSRWPIGWLCPRAITRPSSTTTAPTGTSPAAAARSASSSARSMNRSSSARGSATMADNGTAAPPAPATSGVERPRSARWPLAGTRPLGRLGTVRARRPVGADHGDAVGGGAREHGDAIEGAAPGRDLAEHLRLALTGHAASLVQALDSEPNMRGAPGAVIEHVAANRLQPTARRVHRPPYL